MQKIHIENQLTEHAKKVSRIGTHDKMDVLNIQLRAGEQIPEHNAKDIVVINVQKGELKLNVEGEDHLLTNDDFLMMEPLEMHSLEAVTDVSVIVMKVHV
ncbi:AraC family ligand binding domain-containing protein [Solibacillus cecembensis]|uniref:AraC family ligand binding domain-containing protein n=1 Tax=Solibacillus cecembensis TaxID=459347 RepID=UPI0007174F9C